MKVSELIAVLQGVVSEHGDRDVLCTWESITPPIASIYIAPVGKVASYADFNGELLLDCDGGSYQSKFAETVVWENKE